MKARSLIDRRIVIGPSIFAELVLWELPTPVRGSNHPYKYRLALISSSVCVLRYDNEAGKGDHRHRGEREDAYLFENIDRLVEDFLADVRSWLHEHRNA